MYNMVIYATFIFLLLAAFFWGAAWERRVLIQHGWEQVE